MKTLAEIQPVLAGADPRDVENWISRLELATEYEQPGRGRARLFSLFNTLELAFIAALVRGGAKPSRAAMYAASMLRQFRASGTPSREWLVFPAGDLEKASGLDIPDATKVRPDLRDALTLTFVHVGEIARRVLALYSDEG